MKKSKKPKNLFKKEMQKPSFYKKFIKNYPAFQIEVQLLKELDK